MIDTEGLNKISGCDNSNRAADVIFVHGLDGDAITTWQAEGKPENFWPGWLGQELPEVGIWSMGYAVSSSAWKGSTMPLTDRATNMLDLLDLEGIGRRAVIFVCHSLGGLLVKQMLRHAHDFGNAEYKRIAGQTRAIVFLSTPHSGSNIANWMKHIGTLLRTNVSVNELEAHHPRLRELNLWFRNHPQTHQIKTLVYCEKKTLGGLLVVDETSADPGIAGVVPIPMDDDHVTICKPKNRNSQVYRRVKKLVEEIVSRQTPLETPTIPNLPNDPDSEFIKTVKDNIRRELEISEVFFFRRALDKRLEEALSRADERPEGDLADKLLALSTDLSIGRVLLTATLDCVYKKGPWYNDCAAHRLNIKQSAEQLLGWLVLSSIREDFLYRLYPNTALLPALYFEIPVLTPMGVEIIVSRRFQRESKFDLDSKGIGVVGRYQICSGPNDFIWQETSRVKDVQRAIWNAVMSDDKESDLDASELRRLNEQLAFLKDMEYEAKHFYLPVRHRQGASEKQFDTIYSELLKDLPNLTLVRFGIGVSPDVFVIPEERIMVAIQNFLTSVNKTQV